MSRRRRRKLAISAIVLMSFVTIGAAVASFSAAGSGSGSAATGTTQPVTLTPATPVALLYPGGQAGVKLAISNPNPVSVRVESLSLHATQGSGGFAVDGAHSACDLAALAFATQTNGGAGWTVAGNGSLAVTLNNSLSMTTAAANSCQGASFTIYLKSGA